MFSSSGKLVVSSKVKELTFKEINGVTVSGQVKGYNSANAPEVTLYNSTDINHETPIVTADVETAVASGGQYTWNFSFAGVSAGTYDLVVTKAGHLTYTITGVEVESSDIDLTSSDYAGKAYQTITMLAGDISGDGRINFTDYGILTNPTNYGKNTTDSGVNGVTDLNGDGRINFTDYGILTNPQNYGKSATANCIFSF